MALRSVGRVLIFSGDAEPTANMYPFAPVVNSTQLATLYGRSALVPRRVAPVDS